MTTLLMILIALPNDNWPQFRGPAASGTVAGAQLPATFSVADGKEVRWKAAVPGLAHSSPIVWGELVIVATAEGPQDDPQLKLGLYGAGDAATWQRALRLLAAGRLDVEPIITHRVPLARAEDGFRLALQKQAAKVLLIPGEGA